MKTSQLQLLLDIHTSNEEFVFLETEIEKLLGPFLIKGLADYEYLLTDYGDASGQVTPFLTKDGKRFVKTITEITKLLLDQTPDNPNYA